MTEVKPLSNVPIGVRTLFSVTIQNDGDASGSTSASIRIKGAGVDQSLTTTTATVGIGCASFAFASYTFSTAGAYQIIVTVNPDSTVREWNEGNNSKADTITIVKLPTVVAATDNAPERSVPLKPSSTNGAKSTGWTDNSARYTGNLYITATPSVQGLKSGYGFEMRVQVGKTTSYTKPSYVYDPQKVYMYVPEWGYEKAVELQQTSAGVWQLPVNTSSVTNARKWYVPVWWPDTSDYTVKIETVGAYTPGDPINASLLSTVRIDSNMFTDDYTSNKR